MRLALAVALIAGLLAAPHASSMLQRLVANGVSGKVTFREINEGKAGRPVHQRRTGDAIETLVGKGLLALKMSTPRPMASACKAVKKVG